MKNNKLIILISFIIVGLIIYITTYFLNHDLKMNDSPLIVNIDSQKTQVIPSDKEAEVIEETHIDNSLKDLREVTANINKEESIQFYVLKEEENFTTLISKDKIGDLPYINTCADTTCNLNEYLQNYLKTWTYVGSFDLPNESDVNILKNVLKTSFWLKNDLKEEEEASYYNVNNDEILKDNLNNSHETYVVVQIPNTFIKSNEKKLP